MFARSRRRTSVLLTLLAVLALTAGAVISAQPAAGQANVQAATDDSDASFRSSPVMFIENAGQWPDAARFQVWGAPSGTMWLAEDAIWITVVERSAVPDSQVDRLRDRDPATFNLQPSELPPARAVNIKLSFVGANPHPRIESFDRLDTKVSLFIGDDPDKWQPDVPVWGGVRYVELYPGVDLEITSEDGQMLQRLEARPGADLEAVRLRVEGADATTVDADALRMSTDAGEVAWPLLLTKGSKNRAAAQPSGSKAYEVAAPFAGPKPNLAVQGASSLQSPADDPADLLYAAFLGGNCDDGASSIAADGSGATYITGGTVSTNFPTTPGAFDTSYNSTPYFDAFVVKVNPSGSTLVYATFLGGSNDDFGYSITTNGSGAAYLTGATSSSDFPTTGGAFDRSYNGGRDAFVVKINPSGSALTYATFLGGADSDGGVGIEIDGSGAAYVVGGTQSTGFPTTLGAFDRSYNGGYLGDVFVTKLNVAGSALTYSTFLGGGSDEAGTDIAVDAFGSAYITGYTWSSNFPTTPGAFDRSHGGEQDVFITKLNTAGSSLIYSTLLGGDYGEIGWAIAIDGVGSAYATGVTVSPNFPTTPSAFSQSGDGWVGDAFVVKVSPAGSTLAYATFLGGSGEDESSAISVDTVGNAYIAGRTWSYDFPTTSGAFSRSLKSDYYDAFVAKLSADGSSLIYGTYLGGGDGDRGYSIAIDESGAAYVTGDTESSDFPTTPGALDRSYNGGLCDVFVVKLAMGGASTPTPTPTPTRTPTPTITPTPTPLPDLSVHHIEVAQVFVEQNDPISNATIPLIAQKDTLVRVYVGVSGAASVGGVSARLHIRQPNGTETIDSRPVNVWPVQAKQTPNPFSLQDTVNFRLPTKLLQGNVSFWADVDPANRIPETNESNNTGGQVSKTFQAGKPVRIAITRIGYRNSPFGAYSYADWNTIVRADSMLRQIYPVATNDVSYVYQPGNPEPVQCVLADDDACWTALRNALKTFWYRIEDEEQWATGTAPHALVGWVPGIVREPGGKCGEALQGNPHQTIMTDYCDNYIGAPLVLAQVPVERVLAHEVGHLLNYNGELKHAKNEANAVDSQCRKVAPDPDPQYPTPASYPVGSIFAHGLNLQEPKVLSPKSELPGGSTATYDLMSYCSPAWISPYNYLKLNTGFVDPPLVEASGLEATTTVRKLLVSGLVYAPAFQVELDPFYVLDSALPASASSGSAYCLELRNANGTMLDNRCFDLSFVDPESYEPVTVDGFALTIPYPAGTTQIVLTHLGTPIATRAVSPHVPTVRLISPNGGETWTGSGTHTVTWTASDLDGDMLHFALSYSTDGGASWIPAGLDLTGTQHALDVSMLPGGTSVLLRISATDGVNTTDDVSDASFTVGRKAPMAFILSPEDGAHFFPAQSIWLEGRAFDLEDGTLGDAALRWSSDRDGELGTGKLLIAALSPGEHVITLTATDSDGARATATIRLSAGDRVFLPVVLRSR